MRFNSPEFLAVFLPVTWAVWFVLQRGLGTRAGAAWLTLASLGFYAWWDWRFAPLLVLSLLVNFALGRRLAQGSATGRRRWLLAGLVWNLGLLGFFKYWNFFSGNLNAALDTSLPVLPLVLPLGISFFTFQKIAFLVDAWRGRVRDVRFGDFALFVMFFPQLIAGPIVHHGEFIPQLQAEARWRPDGRRVALGLTLFAAGLFQKCVIADTLAPLADSAFGLAAYGTRLRWLEAWVGVAAYGVQLLNDFAGYSHMALGLALLFGLRLPVNFLAPYTAGSIIEFWRRWHLTLSAFLRDYVYIPLGGNRHGHGRQRLNLFLTMVLAGLWHGAGWTFILWGVWHGAALCVNHLWRRRHGADPAGAAPLWAHVLTLLTVFFGWVLFRAPDLVTARLLGESLLGLHGITVPVAWSDWVNSLAPVVRARGLFPNLTVTPTALLLLAVAGFCAVRGPLLLRFLGVGPDDVTPGAGDQTAALGPAGAHLHWTRAVCAGAMLAIALAALARSSPFLYFQF
jgi:D-alanyl-lipoteichoic acid acyltransferase DltB (MBOAT superfamily)